MTAYDNDNPFAKILRGELPAYKIYEDAETFAFMDIMPRSPGHCLVIPKRPCRNLLDADPAVLAPLMQVARKLSRAAMAAMDADGVMVAQFNEAASGQTVFHLHVHVIPCFEGRRLGPEGGPMEKPDVLNENARKIREALDADAER
ncbi:HIT family protein [Chelativorans sp. AA-79]|uniref:HIT family protein n=1 Tax=Chelativorans sp. AA-79 TaxID=3028735 RepID=UPI0023F78767|nr:HIT family protein [Chelativorans sp. AA-79]WEX11738.1 HIT family protein [Chelativorans sp. AA-79]